MFYRDLIWRRQIAIDVKVSIFAGKFPGLFTIWAVPATGVTLEELEKAIFDELEKLKSDPVSESELSRARNRLNTSFFFTVDDNLRLARTLAAWDIRGSWKKFFDLPHEWKKATPLDIMDVVRKYFSRQRSTVVYLKRKTVSKKISFQKLNF